MSSFIDNPHLYQSTDEARQVISAARAERRAEQAELLRRELAMYSADLLPGGVEALTANPGDLARIHDRAQLAVAIHELMAGGRVDHLKRPELVEDRPVVEFDRDGNPRAPAPTPKPAGMKRDALRAVIDRYKDEFKSPTAAEKFYATNALAMSHLPEAEVIERVIHAMEDRRNNSLLKHEVPPSEATLRLVSALKPLDPQLRRDSLALAEGPLADLASPSAPRFNDRELARIVESRVETFPAEEFVRGEFDPTKVVRPRPVQAAQQQPTPAAKLWTEANREAFERMGI